jgi:ribonuclease J
MIFTIHYGANQIGGSCVELCTNTTRIIIDMGAPLVNEDGSPFEQKQLEILSVRQLRKKKILPEIPVLYDDVKYDKETALLVSHAHQDHYGLIEFVKGDIPVYLGEVTYSLIELFSGLFAKKKIIKNPRFFISEESFTIGDIEITPYLVDHAVPDAYAFLIHADGQTLFYSGDFRSHGRKTKLFYRFLHITPKDVDYLLLEGTTISREEQTYKTESQLENEFLSVFKKTTGINFVCVSSLNTDRIVTIYRAVKATGKILVIDFFLATILEKLHELGYRVIYPSANVDNLRVFFPYHLSNMIPECDKPVFMYKYKNYKITKSQISENVNNIVMIVRPSMYTDLKYVPNINCGNIIFSMWGGYKNDKKVNDFLLFLTGRGLKLLNIHTSGHADTKTLKKLVDTMAPKRLFPIHTSAADKYQDIFPDVKVVRLKNKELYEGKSSVKISEN